MLSAAGGGFAGGKSSVRLYSDPSLPKPDWQSVPLSRPGFPSGDRVLPHHNMHLPRPIDPTFRDADANASRRDSGSAASDHYEQRSPPLQGQYNQAWHPPLPSVSQILTPDAFNPTSQPHSSAAPSGGPPSPLHTSFGRESQSLGIRGPPPASRAFDGPPASYVTSARDRRPSAPVASEGAIHGPAAVLRLPEPQMPIPAPLSTSFSSQSFAPFLGSHRRFSTESTTMPSQEARRRTSTSGSRPRGIWTGAQFLPRFIAEHDVPGEGPCYFYDDGTHCKTVIDGEVVNAQWGVTKAGKPRKRLAVACLTCREKKIKCEPDFPKCVQCEKFGRECRFQNAPRGFQTSPEAHSAEPKIDVGSSPETPPRAFEPYTGLNPQQQSPSLKRRRDPSPAALDVHVGSGTLGIDQERNFLAEKKKKMEGQLSPELSWGMLKGLGSDKMLPQRKGSSEGHFVYATKSPPRDLALTRTHSVFQLHVDPYQSDPELTGQLMEVYFLHINHQCLSLFPSTPFLLWAKTAKDKSDRDLMLLYTIMAVAAHLSPRQEHKSYAETFAGLSRCALERHWNKPSVQLCQSRLLMALYCFAEGQKAEAWEYAGSSLRTASALGLHSEYVPLGEMKVDDSLGYAHTSAAIKEVRRRTFWAVYLADRILSFDTCSPAILNDEDVFLRLPCRDDLFEDGVESSAPFFDNKIINSELCRSVNERNINPMGFLVQIASIYMEVARDVYRTVHCSVNSYKNNYESFYARAEQRLAEWRNSLPSPFIESSENLGRSIQDGRIGIYLGIHAVHFATVMKLNRYARGACLSSQSIRRNIFQAWQCSQRWLQIVRDLNQTKHMLPGRNASVIPPFVSFTTLTACDILSARGRVVDWRTILNGMNEGVALVGDVGVFWASPRMQAKAILGRIAELSRAVLNQSSDQADQVIFAMQFPLESKDNCPQDLDLVYSTPTAWYSDILPSP